MLALLVAMAFLLLNGGQGFAHAYLVSADPPVDGLAVSSPDVLTLSFSEDIEMTSPAPVVRLLDQQGEVIGDDPLPIQESDNPRQLVVPVPDLGPGTYTVSWSLTSATDGHALSGTYAFRVGGGLPPGLATTSESSPAVWAVVTRWLTFLGVAAVVGLLLFPLQVIGAGDVPRRWPRTRAIGILAGALVALAATLAEPLLQWLLHGRDDGSSLGDVVKSLPDDWWWRPWTLIPLALVAVAIVTVLRFAIPRVVAMAGAILALASLLGLVLTSHAAGRETWREVAIGSNMLHQASVALWCGGLVALVCWGMAGRDGSGTARVTWPRFSTIALGLFVVAVASGVVNTNFIFEFLDGIREDGFSADAFAPLWESRYGITLLVKLAILIVPFALAILHRERIRKLASETGDALTGLGDRLRSTIRIELLAVALVIAGGSTLALSAPPQKTENVLDRITLVSPTGEPDEDGSLLVHLTIDPADSGENTFSVRLTDWNGDPIPGDPAPRVTLDFTSISHGTSNPGVALEPSPTDPATFTASGLALSIDGWWQIDARIQRAGQQNTAATSYVLLPDPNTQGFDAPPAPATDPAAEALYTQALSQMVSWERVRWTEHLGSGSDVIVIGEFAMIEATGETPSAYAQSVPYSASFVPTSSGAPPAPPSFDGRSSITIGDDGWLRTANGDWLSEPPTNFSPMSEWGETYAGATSFQMGMQQEIDGRTYQVVTFHLPEQPTQSEAWFAWWIDEETGDVSHMAMVARQHYMTWQYSDIDGEVVIEPPTG